MILSAILRQGLLAPDTPSAGLKEPCTLRKKFNFLRLFFVEPVDQGANRTVFPLDPKIP